MTQTNHPQRLISILFMTIFCVSIATAQSVVAHIPIGRTPTSLAANQATNLVYAVSRQPRSMVVIDGATNTISADVPLNFEPEEIAVNPTTNRIYIAHHISGLFVVNGATNAVITNISLPLGAVRVAVNSVTNRIYVGNSVARTITVIDGNLNTIVDVISLPAYIGGTIAPNTVTNEIWVEHHEFDFFGQTFLPIVVIDGATNTVTHKIVFDVFPGAVAVNELTNIAYMVNQDNSHDVEVFDGATKTHVATIQSGTAFAAHLSRIAVNPTTNHIFVSEPFGQVVHIMDGPTNTLITRMDLGFFAPFPHSLAVNPVTSFVYVANTGFDPIFDHGGQSISVIDDPPPPATQLQALIQKIQQYNFSQGVANSLDSKLQNALAAVESLNNGNIATVCNKLDAFINEVQAKNDITPAQATDLITAANRIKRTLGCDG